MTVINACQTGAYLYTSSRWMNTVRSLPAHWDMESKFQEWVWRQGPSWMPSTDSPVCTHPLWCLQRITTGCGCYQWRGSTWASPSPLCWLCLQPSCHFIAVPLSGPSGSQPQAFTSTFTLGFFLISPLASPESENYLVLLSVLGLPLPGESIFQHSWEGLLRKTLSSLSLHCSKYI